MTSLTISKNNSSSPHRFFFQKFFLASKIFSKKLSEKFFQKIPGPATPKSGTGIPELTP